ncbi:MAG: MlaD family protein, partial [Acidobacteriota bacterium]|nr:MlaD family protein [Acidobacteriota bacterium]
MALESSVGRRFRVGLVVLVALLFLVFGVLMVGKRRHLFTAKLPYHTQFDSASGLVSGNPVRLNGVTVGNVLEVNLSPDPADQRVDVRYEVDRKVAPRLRTGTRASIKTIGLLGDKYVELAGGTAQEPVVPPEGEIKPAPGAGLEKLLEGSGDLLTDLGAIARSLKSILGRTEKGEGFLGQLTSDSPEGGQLGSNLNGTLSNLNAVLAKINRGEGLAGKLLADERYGDEVGR